MMQCASEPLNTPEAYGMMMRGQSRHTVKDNSHVPTSQQTGQAVISETDKRGVPTSAGSKLAALDSGKRRFYTLSSNMVQTGQNTGSEMDKLALPAVPPIPVTTTPRLLVKKLSEAGYTEVRIERSTAYHHLKKIYDAGIKVWLVNQKDVHDRRKALGLPKSDAWDVWVILTQFRPDECTAFFPTTTPQLEVLRLLVRQHRNLKTALTKAKQNGLEQEFLEELVQRLGAQLKQAEEEYVKTVPVDDDGRPWPKSVVLVAMSLIRFGMDGQIESRNSFTTREGAWNPYREDVPKQLQYPHHSILKSEMHNHYMRHGLKKIEDGVPKRYQRDMRRLYYAATQNIKFIQTDTG